jgi:hypothetical protein
MALVQSRKLFPALPLLNTVSYLQEMARVVQDHHNRGVFQPPPRKGVARRKPLALAVGASFDYKRLYAQILLHGSWDRLRRQFSFTLYPAITECMVFRKKSSQAGLPSTLTGIQDEARP